MPNTGVPTVPNIATDPALTGFNAHVHSLPAGSVRMKTGSFTGDGNATKAIAGVGFQPTYVAIWRQDPATMQIYWKSDQDGLNAYTIGMGPVYDVDIIISLDADGFTIGDDQNMNEAAIGYTYVAFG